MKSPNLIAEEIQCWGENHPERFRSAMIGLLALEKAIIQLPQDQAAAIADLANILGEID